MAEAIFNAEARRRGIDARATSAGTLGAGSLNPLAVQALEEIGVSTGGLRPKSLDAAMVQAADRIVSMGCGVDADACPARFVPSEDWGLDDPAGQPIEAVRAIRDQIRERAARLLDEIEDRKNET